MIRLALAAAAGYLLGSVSTARIVAARVLPGEDVADTEVEAGPGFAYRVGRVSPGAVGRRAGARAGGMATLGDMAKAAVAVGVTTAVAGRPAGAVAGAAAVVGHAFPIYHRFDGAFGQSPIIGASLVLDPRSVPAAVAMSHAGSWLVGDSVVHGLLWPVFLIPWAARRSDPVLVGFSLAANAVYLARVWPLVRARLDFRRTHPASARERWAELAASYRSNPFSSEVADEGEGEVG
jgi:glycerol-3-phosphate acyltransferase PlsY